MIEVIDETPQRVRQYWEQFGFNLASVIDNPIYREERESVPHYPVDIIKTLERRHPDPNEHGAYIPPYVTFALRREQRFRCYVTDWLESDWIINKDSGAVRQVGRLTVDHILAGAHGGTNHPQNLRMVCDIANGKKGSRIVPYEHIREHLLEHYKLYVPTPEILVAVEQLRKQKIKVLKLV